MAQTPSDRLYSSTHQWALQQADGTWQVGITDHAQSLLGDLVFVELPAVGQPLSAGEQCAVVESVKTASDVFAPVTGEVLSVNAVLEDSPEEVNDAPYDTWLWTMRGEPASDLMDAQAYEALVEGA